ncbi:hypothetical protein ACFL6K_00060 [Candidatus Latescibacterota bacterium]
MKKCKLFTVLVVIFLIAGTSQLLAENGPNYTSRLYPGMDGKLVYVPDEQGNIIPDFSNAGFGGGGVPIPYVPVKETIWGVEGDATPVIQAAIDRVSALEPDENGIRGAILLKMGYYDLHSSLTISVSGVVLRGQGQDDLGTILIGRNEPIDSDDANARSGGEMRGMGTGTLITISGQRVQIDEESAAKITDDYVPVGARSFSVESTRGFKVGDTIMVRRIGNQEWINFIGEGEELGRNQWRPFDITYDRIITNITRNTVTIDAPIACAIETQWGGGDIMKYDDSGRISYVGIENLRAMSDFDQRVRTTMYGNLDRHPYDAEEYYSDEAHWWNFASFNNAKHCWVRDVTGLHFGGSLVSLSGGVKWTTVQDCKNLEPVAQRWGARRTAFASSGQLNLVQRCLSDRGRHSFVTMGQQSAGPNVFLECTATRSYSTSEPHSHWVTGMLYDSVHGPLTARYWKDISIGWAGANIVFWNCEGEFRMQNPPTAFNSTFGHIGINATPFNMVYQDNSKEDGHMESLDRHVTPGSLYLKQLEDRLGPQALANIAKKEQ